MIIRPIYNILLLPDVSYYFKKDFFSEWSSEPIEAGTDILFLQLKEEQEDNAVRAEDFYPIGISARVEGASDGDTVQVRTLERVDVSGLEIENGQITAEASIRPEQADMTEEEEKASFSELRSSLLKFVQGYQWGLWARSFILQRKNVYDLACALTEYLNLSVEEKYAILATDSRRERYELITRSIREFMEVARVSEEARTAQKDNQEQLYREATQLAALQPNETLLDLYCGAGTIGLSMVQPGQKLIGVEVVHSAVENARQNAVRAGVTDAEFLCADAGKASQILAERGLRPDVIVLDPPRKGCDNDTLQAVVRMAPSRIIMVSCNPATMARDAAILREMGYDLQCYRPVDLFPRTAHCETVGLFTKQ